MAFFWYLSGMPTPIGHSVLGLVTAALFYWTSSRSWRQSLAAFWKNYRWAICLGVFCADSPDLDLVPGLLVGDARMFHRLYTHTFLWVILVATICWWIWRRREQGVSWREWAFLFLSGCTHLLADWLGEDFRPPYGIMPFWPFSSEYYICSYSYFAAVKKDTVRQVFSWYSVWLMVGEFLKTLPLLALVLWFRNRVGGWQLEPDLTGRPLPQESEEDD